MACGVSRRCQQRSPFVSATELVDLRGLPRQSPSHETRIAGRELGQDPDWNVEQVTPRDSTLHRSRGPRCSYCNAAFSDLLIWPLVEWLPILLA
jgi:hypothetical protein